MSQTIYLSDDEERIIFDALYNKMMIEYDAGNTDEGDEISELRDKIRKKMD